MSRSLNIFYDTKKNLCPEQAKVGFAVVYTLRFHVCFKVPWFWVFLCTALTALYEHNVIL